MESSLDALEKVLTDNCNFIIKHLEADDLIDELIQERLLGRSGAQRVQLQGTSREQKNRIICEQLTTAGPDALNKFCKILRNSKRQLFIAERLEKCKCACLHEAIEEATYANRNTTGLHLASTQCTNGLPPVKMLNSSPVNVTTITRLQTRLALVKGEKVTKADNKLEEFTRMTLQGQVDEILLRKEPLEGLRDIFYYQDKPCPRLILVMGAPGIGKTTLANEICVRWARDGFLKGRFDVVLLIPLRSAQKKSVEEVTVKHIGGEEAFTELKKSAGTRCLIIFEGLDEISMERQRSDEFFVAVVTECTLLEQATILITSRPHACESISAGRRVEIVGFGSKEVREFVHRSITDVKTVEQFLLKLDEFPHIRSLCYIPMNLVMVVDIFQVKKELPSTLTELYKLFIIMIIQRQLKKEGEKPSCLPLAVPAATEETLCKLFNGIPKDAVRTVFILSRLAYCGFIDWYSSKEGKGRFSWETKKWKDPKIIFTIEDLTECGIEVTADWDGYGLLKATPTHDVPVDTVTYNFAHLTIQEFLCALYLSTLSDQKQQRLLIVHFSHYPNLFTFFCGIARLVSPATSQFVFEKLKSDSSIDVLTALRCVYESGETNPPQSASPLYMDLRDTTLHPYDYICVSRVLSIYSVLKLYMNWCHIGDSGAEIFEKNYSSVVLQELDLAGNNLTMIGIKHVMKIVMKSSASLRVLNVGRNPIGDNAMSLIVDHLYHNTTLNELYMRSCKLSAKGASYVGKWLKNNCTLKVLNMAENAIGDSGISLLMKGLHHNTSLKELNVMKCGLSVEGAFCTGECLKVNHTLKVLDMSNNHFIGDVGISQLVKGLYQNTSLTELGVMGCGLSVKGARCIGELLQINTVLHSLRMGLNKIGDDGTAMVAGALGKSKISLLSLYDCDITVAGAKELAAGLSVNQSIKELYIGDNPITVEGAHLVLQSSLNNGVCEEVYMDDEYEADSEVRRMRNIMYTRNKAKKNNNSGSTHDRGQEDKELISMWD